MMVCFLDKIRQAEAFHHSALLWVQMTCQGQQLMCCAVSSAVFVFEVYFMQLVGV